MDRGAARRRAGRTTVRGVDRDTRGALPRPRGRRGRGDRRARRARVRRAYLAVRADDVPRGRRDLRGDHGRAARVARGVASRPRRRGSRTTASARRSVAIEPLDSLGIARWLVALVGPAASSWALPERTRGRARRAAPRALDAAAPEAWTLDDVRLAVPSLRTAIRDGAVAKRRDAANRWLALTRELLAPRPSGRARSPRPRTPSPRAARLHRSSSISGTRSCGEVRSDAPSRR